jgi:hypothetical protein
MSDPLVCLPRALPQNLWVSAARTATEINPANHPRLERLAMLVPGFSATPQRIAVVTTKFWRTNGVRLTVGFLDNPPADLRRRIVEHMNAWSKTTNVKFTESKTDPQVRIARIPNDGYWSYLGTDILSIPRNQPTMNLEGFTMNTPESEFRRVVRHETGHTLGCPHEHMRRQLVAKIDPAKAIRFFGQTQGWSPEMVRQQVLTPIEESSLRGTAFSDPNSIMCYQIPGTITRDGKPIIGGTDIDKTDYDFMATIYPKAVLAPSSTKGSTGGGRKGGAKKSGKGGAKKSAGKSGAKKSSKGGSKGGAKKSGKGGAKKSSKGGSKKGGKGGGKKGTGRR